MNANAYVPTDCLIAPQSCVQHDAQSTTMILEYDCKFIGKKSCVGYVFSLFVVRSSTNNSQGANYRGGGSGIRKECR